MADAGHVKRVRSVMSEGSPAVAVLSLLLEHGNNTFVHVEALSVLQWCATTASTVDISRWSFVDQTMPLHSSWIGRSRVNCPLTVCSAVGCCSLTYSAESSLRLVEAAAIVPVVSMLTVGQQELMRNQRQLADQLGGKVRPSHCPRQPSCCL